MSEASRLEAHGAGLLAAITQIRSYAIFLVDRDARALSWNEGVSTVLGFGRSDFLGLDVGRALFAPEAIAQGVPRQELDEAAVRGQASDDRWMCRKDGSRFFAHGVTSAVHDDAGEVVGFVKVLRDRTDEHRLQQRLQQLVQALGDAERQRHEHLTVLAHELRNPLAPLQSGVRLLSGQADAPDRTSGVIAMMSRQIAHMRRLVDDLLDVSRITLGRIDLRLGTVGLQAVVDAAVEAVRGACEERGQTLSASQPTQAIQLQADDVRLTQVIGHLLANACQFTPRGGRIALTSALEDGAAVVRVRDTGIGFEDGERESLFEMFAPARAAEGGSADGLGVGLAMARRLVELHGGSIEAHSAGRGRGSEFVIRLPLAAASPTQAASPPAAPAQRPRARKVLVVDDNQDAAQSLAALLSAGGHAALVVHDGGAALQAARAERWDLIVMDIGMPGMSGHDVARQIRALPENGHRPVLAALTGWGQPDDCRRSAEAGFDVHWVKPVDMERLEQLLATLDPHQSDCAP